MLRRGVLILGAMMKQRGWDVEVYMEDLRRIVHNSVLPMENDLDAIPYPDISLLKPEPRRQDLRGLR